VTVTPGILIMDTRRLPRAQCELAAGLEALGDQVAALKVAAEALAGLPGGGQYRDDRAWLAVAVLRLSRTSPAHHHEPLVEALIASAVAGVAATSLEARVWAAVDLLDIPGQREAALALTGQVSADLAGPRRPGGPGARCRVCTAAAGRGPGGAYWPMIVWNRRSAPPAAPVP
jgi:hypothetical protein